MNNDFFEQRYQDYSHKIFLILHELRYILEREIFLNSKNYNQINQYILKSGKIKLPESIKIYNDLSQVYNGYYSLAEKLSTIKLLKTHVPEIESKYNEYAEYLRKLFSQKIILDYTDNLEIYLDDFIKSSETFLIKTLSQENRDLFVIYMENNFSSFFTKIESLDNKIFNVSNQLKPLLIPVLQFRKIMDKMMKILNISWFAATADATLLKTLENFSFSAAADENTFAQINATILQIISSLLTKKKLTNADGLANQSIKISYNLFGITNELNDIVFGEIDNGYTNDI